MKKPNIETHDTKTFLNRYLQPDDKMDKLLKTDYNNFFIVKVQDMIKAIKLPVPFIKATNHTILFLSEGEANMTIGGKSYTIYKNECLIVAAGQTFSFATEDINKGYLCNFNTDFFIGKFGKTELLDAFDFLKIWSDPFIKIDKKNSSYLIQLFKRIYNQYSESGYKNIDIIQSSFIALLFEINNIYKPFSTGKKSNAIDLTNKFRELVHKFIFTKQKVSDYAIILNVSPNHLNKTIKSITGKSCKKWINEILILEAKVMLFQTQLSISEISTEFGIYDSSYFSRFFKKHEGKTPFEFLKMIEKS